MDDLELLWAWTESRRQGTRLLLQNLTDPLVRAKTRGKIDAYNLVLSDIEELIKRATK